MPKRPEVKKKRRGPRKYTEDYEENRKGYCKSCGISLHGRKSEYCWEHEPRPEITIIPM